jgi:hypothetical protein
LLIILLELIVVLENIVLFPKSIINLVPFSRIIPARQIEFFARHFRISQKNGCWFG